MKTDMEKILVDLRAAHAFIDRVEFALRRLYAENDAEIDANTPVTPQERSERADGTPVPQNAAKPCSSPQELIFPEMACFKPLSPSSDAPESSKKNFAKKGCPTLSRQQVLENFRNIAGDREILDLADVNRIFGYCKSTSGSFVKHAVKRGELGSIPYGKSTKFLAIDVKAFIRSYYDGLKQGEK